MKNEEYLAIKEEILEDYLHDLIEIMVADYERTVNRIRRQKEILKKK